MSNFFNKINEFFKAQWWSGASWLITLCVIHALLILFYVWAHVRIPGQEYLQLETDQVKTINNLLSIYPDTQQPTSLLKEYSRRHPDDTVKKRLLDSISNIRIQRTATIREFLKTEYHKLDSTQLAELGNTMLELNTKDAATYLTEKKFLVGSFFWLSGRLVYWEAMLWSFIGVITSLIYYVSVANQLSLKKAEDDDIGPFDTSEISAQVAKMFYAPIITLVLVVGYSYFSSKNASAINISVNHGLILFCFMAGFYSGRLMKLLDGLKNLILPVASDSNPPLKTGDAPAAGTKDNASDISVQLTVSDAVTNSPEGAGIAEAGFNAAVVTLELTGKPGDPITLTPPANDQEGVFTGAKIANGKYTLKAKYAYNNKSTILNLYASQDIEVSAANTTFAVALEEEKGKG